MLRIGFVVAALLTSQGAAKADWFARCTGLNNSCHGEACGATPDEARARCLEICPDSDTHSVGTSSCVAPRTTTQQQQKVPRAAGATMRPAPAN
jgi:hypothetical protein